MFSSEVICFNVIVVVKNIVWQQSDYNSRWTERKDTRLHSEKFGYEQFKINLTIATCC